MASVASKGQMLTQVFVFILAGLVFILIMAYGYKAITYFLEKQEMVSVVEFRDSLELAVESVKRDVGTVRKVQLSLPSKFQGVCFFDYDRCASQDVKLVAANGEVVNVPWAQKACQVSKKNVFTVPSSDNLEFPDIAVDTGAICIPNTGEITIRLEGTGTHAKVSAWGNR